MLEEATAVMLDKMAELSGKPNDGQKKAEDGTQKIKMRVRKKQKKVKAPRPQKKNDKKNKNVIYSTFVLDAALLVGGLFLFALKPTCKNQATLEDTITFDNFKCGVSKVKPNMDSNKKTAVKNSWPWLARLRSRTASEGHSKTPVCAATVITTLHVISACQCVKAEAAPSDFLVSIGDHIHKQTGAKLLEVEKFRRHPHCILPAIDQYKVRLKSNDVLLVTLKAFIQFNDFVQPACLPVIRTWPTATVTCRIYYWPYHDDGPLEQFPLKISSEIVCSKAMEYALDKKKEPTFFDRKNIFCTEKHSGDKICMQVSGGPLTCHEDDKWILRGVASWGLDCNKMDYITGIYSAVIEYMSWICCFMQNHPDCVGSPCKNDFSVKPGESSDVEDESVVAPEESVVHTTIKPLEETEVKTTINRPEESVVTPADSSAVDNSKCGVSRVKPNMDKNDAVENSWPWLARLRKKTDKAPLCSATVLTTRHVISACHCVKENASPTDFLVSVGDHVSSQIGKLLEVAKIRLHPHCYQSAYGRHRVVVRSDDVLMATLKANIQFNKFVQPACLPEYGIAPTSAFTCRIYYWVNNKHGYLQQFLPKILPRSFCLNAMDYALNKKEDLSLAKSHNFCTRRYTGDNKCKQPGGGPLTCQQNGKWVLHGIASWGMDCQEMNIISGIYSTISENLFWICCFMRTHPNCHDIGCEFPNI